MKTIIYYLSIILLLLIVFSETVNSQPNPPQNLTAVLNPTTNVLSVKLTWDGNSPAVAIRYNIYRKSGAISDTGTYIKKYPNVMHSIFYDNQVQPNHTYSYYVTAVNNTGESEPSNLVEITIVPPSLTQAKLSGLVLNDSTGLPIFRAKVKVINNNSNFVRHVETNQNGFFITLLPPGSYFVQTHAPGFKTEFYDNSPTIQNAAVINLAASDSVGLNIGLEPFTPTPINLLNITGTVTDDLNNPLRARITLFRLRNNSHHWAAFHTVTDSNGNYLLKAKEGDTVIVFAQPINFEFLPEYYNNKTNFNDADRIVVNGNVDNINFQLERRPVFNNGISGSVSDTLQNPVESMVIAFKKNVNAPALNNRRYVTLTDSLTGGYNFNNLLPGEYILLAKPKANFKPTYFRYDGMPTLNWRFADSVVVTDNGVISNINFTVRPLPDSGHGKVNGLVKDNSSNNVIGAFVYALDNENRIFAYAITNENGQFLMEGLVPGEYQIVCDMIGFNYSTKDVTIDYENNLNPNLSFTITPDDGITSLDDNLILSQFMLEQNYPNPFNPSTVIKYQISEDSKVTLKVFDILGNEVAELVNSFQNAGSYSVTFKSENLTTGVYFYTLQAGNKSETKKMLLMK